MRKTSLPGRDLDEKVQLYIRKTREKCGISINTHCTGSSMCYCLDITLLAEVGGPFTLNRSWSQSLLKCTNFVQRRAITARIEYSNQNYTEAKRSFLQDVVTVVTMEEVPSELVLNWDQTGIKLVPASSWTMERQGAPRVEMIGENAKRQATAVFCGRLIGDFRPIQVIYKGCHLSHSFPPTWSITHLPEHWSTERTMLEYLTRIIAPYVERVRMMLDRSQLR